MKPYPPNIWDICKELRLDGPTPCWWPQCECDGKPPVSIETYLESRKVSPFREYLNGVVNALAGTVVVGTIVELIKEIFR